MYGGTSLAVIFYSFILNGFLSKRTMASRFGTACRESMCQATVCTAACSSDFCYGTARQEVTRTTVSVGCRGGLRWVRVPEIMKRVRLGDPIGRHHARNRRTAAVRRTRGQAHCSLKGCQYSKSRHVGEVAHISRNNNWLPKALGELPKCCPPVLADSPIAFHLRSDVT